MLKNEVTDVQIITRNIIDVSKPKQFIKSSVPAASA